eukprot:758744-Hanusia_phi.AAC.2
MTRRGRARVPRSRVGPREEGAEEVRGARGEEELEVEAEDVLVLGQEAAAVVGHVPRVVANEEAEGSEARSGYVRMHHPPHLVREALVRPCGHSPLLVQHRKDAAAPILQQLHARLVVAEVHVAPLDPLLDILLLLPSQHKVVELLLQPLIGEVDAELLEAVRLQDLETEDVKDADAQRGGGEGGGGGGSGQESRRCPLPLLFLQPECLVNSGDEPVEELGVEGLAHRVPGGLCLLLRQLHPHRLHRRADLTSDQHLLQLLRRAPQQGRRLFEPAPGVRSELAAVSRPAELEVAKVKDSSEQAEHLQSLLFLQPHQVHRPQSSQERGMVVFPLLSRCSSSCQADILLCRLQPQLAELRVERVRELGSSTELVEDVKVPFVCRNLDDA